MNDLDRCNDGCRDASNKFVSFLSTLIDIFSEVLEGDTSITQLRKDWVLVRRALSNQDIIDQCASYFLFFEKSILGSKEDHDKMADYDFSKMIVPGTAETTRALIMSLTSQITSAWKKGDEDINASIVSTTKKLVQYAKIYERFKAKIDKLEI